MGQSVEIERKFLVRSTPAELASFPGTEIRQGYLAVSDKAEVRLRARSGRYTETVKSTGDLQRSEHQIELSAEQFEALWPATGTHRVEKTRYAIEHGGKLVELDVYRGRLQGLMTAEVEFSSREEAMAFETPEWFGPELTADARYKNRNLAIKGLPELS